MTGPARSKKPKGLRRVERWVVGLAMGVIAFVLEKAVMRSVKKGGGAAVEPDAHHDHVEGRRGRGPVVCNGLVLSPNEVDQQAERQQAGQHAERRGDPAGHAVGQRGERRREDRRARRQAESASRRPARRIVVSSVVARKFTSSF